MVRKTTMMTINHLRLAETIDQKPSTKIPLLKLNLEFTNRLRINL